MGNTFNPLLTRTVTIATDLSSKAYHFVNLHGSSEDVVELATGATKPLFILQEDGDGSATEITGSVCVLGFFKIKLGGTVAPGDRLTATTGGKAIKTTTDTNWYGAIALEDGVANDVIQCFMSLGMVAG